MAFIIIFWVFYFVYLLNNYYSCLHFFFCLNKALHWNLIYCLLCKYNLEMKSIPHQCNFLSGTRGFSHTAPQLGRVGRVWLTSGSAPFSRWWHTQLLLPDGIRSACRQVPLCWPTTGIYMYIFYFYIVCNIQRVEKILISSPANRKY